MRKRIVAFAMAVVVAFGCVGYRPQKAYAAEFVMTAEALEMLYALLLSMGIVISAGESHESKLEATEVFYNSLSSIGQGAVGALFSTMTITGESLYTVTDGFDRSILLELWESVFSSVPVSTVFSPSIAHFQKRSHFSSSGSDDFEKLDLGGCLDSPLFVLTSAKGDTVGGRVYALLPSGFSLSYKYINEKGKLDVHSVFLTPVPAETRMYLSLAYFFDGTYHKRLSTVPQSGHMFDALDVEISDDPSRPYGIAWGNSSYGYKLGNVYEDILSIYDGVSIYGDAYELGNEGLMDADTWADTMSNVHETDKEVGIYTGKDLSGYNTSESAFEDLITGVKNPALNPDIPVSPDLTGISGVLGKILSALKALASAIAIAVVGTGTLDFSKFNNIKLAGVFPFCIPFDLINVFKSFNGVQPIEPKWTIDLAGTPLKAGGKIELDLTQFGVWISIIRYFCYASFVVGLIVITRKVIKG